MSGVLVEYRCPKGHLSYFRNFISDLRNREYHVLITYDEYFECLDNTQRERFLYFSLGRSAPRYKGSIQYRLALAVSLLKVFWIVRKRKDLKRFVFLSYEVASMFILSPFVNKEKYLIEHNNIDEAERSLLQNVLYRFLASDNTVHICFEEYIARHIQSSYGKTTGVWPHPQPVFQGRSQKANIFKKFVFAPSSDNESSYLVWLAELLDKYGIAVVAKTSVVSEKMHKNIIARNFFDNYEELVCNSLAVVIASKFEYRVSGVFYEAVGNKKKVIFSDCLFAREIRHKYKDLTVVGDNSDIILRHLGLRA